ncbi:phage tail sheath family protein [Trinickia acidisoli]|uniref:phage tail sheath family protein n=1 Tax=Trinickia acidisoli TaxID=2767482 RepID=UPI001A8E3D2B|nr:phage tail sheath C-terminal domain-containing protein [Trinickia acidisoli]
MADGNSYSHPGVYIQELPGIPSIQGVSTSIPVIIGATEKLDSSDRNVARRVSSWAEYQSRYGGFVWGACACAAAYEFFAEGGAVCYVIGICPDTPPKLALATVTDGNGNYQVTAASQGDWPNSLLQVTVTDVGPIPKGAQASNYFSVNVVIGNADLQSTDQDGTIWRKLFALYIANNSIRATTLSGQDGTWYVLESFGPFTAMSLTPAGDGGPCPLQAQINAKSMFIRVLSTPQPGDVGQQTRAGTPVKLDGGDPVTYDSSIYDGALPALASIPDASLLATPDAAVVELTSDSTSAQSLTSVITDVMTHCQKLPNLFYVIDAPYVDDSTDTDNIVAFVAGGATNNTALIYENAALYYPWTFVLNPVTGTSVPIPPSGPVLGRYATTDLTAGVHVSPAGVRTGRIATATALTGWLTESDQDDLNPHGINAIRNIAGYGVTIYGARTLAGPGQWQYIAVRRFVTFVELSLKTSLQWVVFQPNSELLWATVVREITAFLTLVWHQGALFGSTADEAFFVTCDSTNNPPALRAQGVLNIDVGLAVLYPAEFVVIRIAQMTSSQSSGS